MSINANFNEADRRGKDAHHFTFSDFEAHDALKKLEKLHNKPQDAYFWVGQYVVACTQERGKLRNGLEYEILELGAANVVLRAVDKENAPSNSRDCSSSCACDSDTP